MMSDFQSSQLEINFKYENHSMFIQLEEKYGLLEIAGNKNTLSKAINLLEWLSTNTYHNGSSTVKISDNALDLLNYSFNNGESCGMNCRALSITLAECCLTIGLKARAVYIMPFSPYDGDNHVVCEVWISELNKWIMLDPTYGSYVMDVDGNILNTYEVRTVLANQEDITFSKEINYNGNFNQNADEIKEYYAKNLFYFSCLEIHTYNSQKLENNRHIFFVPTGYDVKKSILVNIDYRIRKSGDGGWLKDHRKLTEERNFLYCPIEELLKIPN